MSAASGTESYRHGPTPIIYAQHGNEDCVALCPPPSCTRYEPGKREDSQLPGQKRFCSFAQQKTRRTRPTTPARIKLLRHASVRSRRSSLTPQTNFPALPQVERLPDRQDARSMPLQSPRPIQKNPVQNPGQGHLDDRPSLHVGHGLVRLRPIILHAKIDRVTQTKRFLPWQQHGLVTGEFCIH